MNIKAGITIIHTICLLLCLNGCINEFIPKGVEEERGFFVVDGTITDGESVFTLSRSVGISEKLTGEETVDNAIVTVESSDGVSIPAEYRGEGRYIVQTGNLDPALQYRLAISMDGEIFQSDFLSPIMTAGIDSIFPVKKGKGDPVSICVSTHDPSNSSQYYRWTYHETWEVKSELFATARMEKGVLIYHNLNTPENTYYCWGRDSSKTLLIASTVQLSENVISQEKLIDIPCEHDKLSILYHVEVEQMQIREAAYNYFFDMQQKVESTGSLFSPILTTGISGNIRCLNDPERMIIGYIDVSTITKKDLYVWEKEGYFEAPQQICPSAVTTYDTGYIYILGESTVRLPYCVDCRKRENASKNKPDDWPTRHL